MVLRLCVSEEAPKLQTPCINNARGPLGAEGGGLFAETPSHHVVLTHTHAFTSKHTQTLMHKHNKCASLSSRYRTLFLEAAFPAGRSFVTLLFITFACAVINPLLFCEQNDYLNNCWFCAAGYLQLSGS